MYNIFILFKNNLKLQILKKPTTFIILLLAPLVIMFAVMKILFNDSGIIKIGIVDKDKTIVSEMIVDNIKNIKSISVVSIEENKVNSGFSENTLNGVIKIKTGFQDSVIDGDMQQIDIVTKEGQESFGDLIKSLLSRDINKLQNISIVAKGDKDVFLDTLKEVNKDKSINLEKKTLNDLHDDYEITQIFLGFIIFFMLLRGSSNGMHYYEEKNSNVFNRFFSAPIRTYEYYLADFFSSIFTIIIQIIIGVIGVLLLNVNIGLRISELFIICLLVGIASVTLSICVRAFLDSETTYNMVFNFLIMVFIMIGGCFIPLDMMPDVINKISYFTPVRWAMEALLGLQQGMSFKSILPYMGMIMLFSIVFFSTAIIKTKYSEKRYEN